MIELWLRYDGGGRFSPASHVDFKTASENLRQGEEILARITRPRSNKENRLLHGAIKSAWDNQRGGPFFSEEEGGWLKLRSWLLCEAGHCDLHEFKRGSISPEVIQVLKQTHADCFWSADRRTGMIRMRRPRSIKFSLVNSDEFQPIKNKVLLLLCEVICPGTTPEMLMEIRHQHNREDVEREVA
jgi:hypothetical protein